MRGFVCERAGVDEQGRTRRGFGQVAAGGARHGWSLQPGLLRHVQRGLSRVVGARRPVEAEVARTHGGLIAAFSLHLVKTGRVSIELGRALNRAEEIRRVADYRGDSVGNDDAAWAVDQAFAFVRAMQELCSGQS